MVGLIHRLVNIVATNRVTKEDADDLLTAAFFLNCKFLDSSGLVGDSEDVLNIITDRFAQIGAAFGTHISGK
jgi:hypothetical protein